MDRHTPGPWHAAKSADGEHYNVRRSPGAHLNLAIVKPLLPSEGGAEATEANARLIETAPELLDAANDLVSDAADGGVLKGDPEQPVPVPRYKLKALAEAAAKAEGRGDQ